MTPQTPIDFLDQQLAAIRAAFERNGIALPPDDKMSARELAADIEIQLRQSFRAFDVDNTGRIGDDFFRFAAANLATAYACRVQR